MSIVDYDSRGEALCFSDEAHVILKLIHEGLLKDGLQQVENTSSLTLYELGILFLESLRQNSFSDIELLTDVLVRRGLNIHYSFSENLIQSPSSLFQHFLSSPEQKRTENRISTIPYTPTEIDERMRLFQKLGINLMPEFFPELLKEALQAWNYGVALWILENTENLEILTLHWEQAHKEYALGEHPWRSLFELYDSKKEQQRLNASLPNACGKASARKI